MSKQFVPTPEQRQQVQTLAGYGLKQDNICTLILNQETGRPIDKNTLEKHFAHELELGVHKANTAVVQSLFKITQDDKHKSQAAACMFWCKTRMGWREVQDINMSGSLTVNLVNYAKKKDEDNND